MPAIVFSCAVVAALALPPRSGAGVVPAETVIRLTVQPMPAPKPALRYLLLPELKEMSPGNPIPNYLKCFLDQDFSADQEVLGRAALRQADRAARLDRPDWQIQLKLKADGINLLLPDVQKIRALSAGLQARFREEISQQRFDDALVTAKTLFAISRHMSEHPTVIGDLVGIAIAFMTIAPLDDMLEQPGCPNLYWALTNLPHPLVPLDKGLEGERVMILAELRSLDDTDPMSPDQISELIAHVDQLRAFDPATRGRKTRAWLAERTKDEGRVRAARARLVEVGFAEERLLRFPPEQMILLDEKREYEVRRDDEIKHLKLAIWEIEAVTTRPRPARDPALFDFLIPTLIKVRRAQARLEQRLALLRHVEALRLYAADHDGKLPDRLADVGVPLPPDPITGKPFPYRVDGATAHLRGSPPPGEEKIPAFNVRYEVTIRKDPGR
ncbi:MAG: hypothetical protein JWO38_3198 [Gemmataceae bacterium]|nr:hypothetical protein [Gemmataceae bacterium]